MIKQLSKFTAFRLIHTFSLCLLCTPLFAHASLELHISESQTESILIETKNDGSELLCTGKNKTLFNPALGISQLSEHLYLQRLNSEASDDTVYLKAARMGGGIYIHLPYFIPSRDCKEVYFEIKAKHILWGDKWYTENIRFSAKTAKGKSIFFTNETDPVIKGNSYFDASIPVAMLAKLESAFAKINSYYQDVLLTNPLDGIGVVVGIVHNEGKYFGYGGDSLNIIRMSFDNPRPEHLLILDQLMQMNYTHELAHKLQSERLFKLPLARHIVEGGAEFLKIIVLHGAGLMNDGQAKNTILKAAADCEKFADSRSLREKSAQQSFNFREPYDCGMVYYFVVYYSSGLDTWDFIDRFRKAMSGEENYGNQQKTLCLLFESDCTNERLNDVSGNKSHYLQQVQWLKEQLSGHPTPFLTQQK